MHPCSKGLRLLGIGLILFAGVLTEVFSVEFVEANDPRLLEIREHVLKAWRSGRPEPDDQCKEEVHFSAVRMYTRVLPATEQIAMLRDMEFSIVNGGNDYFIGLPETIAALASTKIKYLLYWEGLLINSATYRNPLTGRAVTLHTMFSPSTEIALNYTEPETGGWMELVNCYPFPKWVSRYYRNFVPRLTRLEVDQTDLQNTRNVFVRSSDGIGGRFTEPVVFMDNKWLMDVYRRSSVRKTIILRGLSSGNVTLQNPEEATPNVNEKHDNGTLQDPETLLPNRETNISAIVSQGGGKED